MESHVTIKIAFKEYLMPIKMLQYVMGKGDFQHMQYEPIYLFLFNYKHIRKYANMLTIVR